GARTAGAVTPTLSRPRAQAAPRRREPGRLLTLERPPGQSQSPRLSRPAPTWASLLPLQPVPALALTVKRELSPTALVAAALFTPTRWALAPPLASPTRPMAALTSSSPPTTTATRLSLLRPTARTARTR